MMKTILSLSILTILFLSCEEIAPQRMLTTIFNMTGNPHIHLSGNSVDFEDVVLSETATETIRITNTGFSALTIQKVEITGEGFSADFSKNILLPGDFTDLNLFFAPLSLGAVSGQANIFSNDQEKPEISIALAGSGIQHIPNPMITIISPNGDEDWEIGSTQTVQWNSQDIGNYVKIDLYKSGSFYATIDNSEYNDGSYSWTISSSYVASNYYKIRITDTNNSSIYDYSDDYFSISEASVVFYEDFNNISDWENDGWVVSSSGYSGNYAKSTTNNIYDQNILTRTISVEDGQTISFYANKPYSGYGMIYFYWNDEPIWNTSEYGWTYQSYYINGNGNAEIKFIGENNGSVYLDELVLEWQSTKTETNGELKP